MNFRTTLLLGVMVLVVGAWVGDQFGLLAVLDNAGSAHESQLEKLGRQISKAESIIEEGNQADAVLSVFESRSLPYDPVAARSEYQSWLTSLVEQHKISKSASEVRIPAVISVKSAEGNNKEAYKRYDFTLNGIGRLENITKLLFSFYDSGHLHKITSMTISPTARGLFNISVIGEALAIPSCDRKDELSSTRAVTRLAFDTIDPYRQVVRRNIFSREENPVLSQVSLSSVTYDKSGVPEAWFHVGPKKSSKRLQRQDHFQISIHRIEVVDVQPRSVVIDLDGVLLDIALGQNVQSALDESTPASKHASR